MEIQNGMNDKRKDDGISALIFEQLTEIISEQKKVALDLASTNFELKLLSQNQKDKTLPMLEKVVSKIFGNGTKGMLDDITCIKKDIDSINEKTKETQDLRIWVRNMTVTTVISIIGGLLLIVWELTNK